MSLLTSKNRIHTFSFTDSFIERLTTFIEERYIKEGRDLSRVAIVFGGKRPSMFLKRELARRIKRPFVSPQFLTIDDLISRLVSREKTYQAVSDLDHCYVIYDLARRVCPSILRGR